MKNEHDEREQKQEDKRRLNRPGLERFGWTDEEWQDSVIVLPQEDESPKRGGKDDET